MDEVISYAEATGTRGCQLEVDGEDMLVWLGVLDGCVQRRRYPRGGCVPLISTGRPSSNPDGSISYRHSGGRDD